MAFDYNPMDAFQVGREIGRVNSPVSGIGDAIRNILDDARKKGLLQAQSQYQGQEAISLDAIKRQREQAANAAPAKVTYVGQTPAEDRVIPTTVGEAGNFHALPAPPLDIFDTINKLKDMEKLKQEAEKRGGVPFPIENGTSGEPMFATNGSQRIYSNDGGNSWRDVATGKIIQ